LTRKTQKKISVFVRVYPRFPRPVLVLFARHLSVPVRDSVTEPVDHHTPPKALRCDPRQGRSPVETDTLPHPEVTFHPLAVRLFVVLHSWTAFPPPMQGRSPVETDTFPHPETIFPQEKKPTPYPLPVGEGQADTPITHPNQGEVPPRQGRSPVETDTFPHPEADFHPRAVHPFSSVIP